jgi:flavin-dependent dehydrogenase
MAERYDLVVVGAGPGGSSAAYHSAKAGLNTLLIDRQEFPREPTYARAFPLPCTVLGAMS